MAHSWFSSMNIVLLFFFSNLVNRKAEDWSHGLFHLYDIYYLIFVVVKVYEAMRYDGTETRNAITFLRIVGIFQRNGKYFSIYLTSVDLYCFSGAAKLGDSLNP